MSSAFNFEIMELFFDFLTLADPTARTVVIGAVLLGASSALVGCFTFLRKRALLGDAVAHSLLPGVCLAFILSGTKNPFVLLLGAVITGWISLLTVDLIVNKTKLKTDAAIGIVLSVFFGVGILLLTSIQHSGSGNQSGLDKFLFGKAASMTWLDVQTIIWVAVLILAILGLFYKELKLLAFDQAFAHSVGLPIRTLEFVLSTLTVLSVAIGIQAVGVVLMAALLITPAAAARFWTNKLPLMLFLAALIGVVSAWVGSFVSYSNADMPTGPWIVIVLSLISIFSAFFAPRRGVLARLWQQRQNRIKILKENILKTFYNIGEQQQSFESPRPLHEIQDFRQFRSEVLNKGLNLLTKERLLEKEGIGVWRLTDKGIRESARIVRLHRLWELYLNKRLNLAPDHVHDDAEAMEHIITPEIEQQLEKELGYPELDPHESKIPKPSGNTGR